MLSGISVARSFTIEDSDKLFTSPGANKNWPIHTPMLEQDYPMTMMVSIPANEAVPHLIQIVMFIRSGLGKTYQVRVLFYN